MYCDYAVPNVYSTRDLVFRPDSRTKTVHTYTILFSLVISEKKYTINVKTGDVSGAGTDANVFLIVYGDLGTQGNTSYTSQRHTQTNLREDMYVSCGYFSNKSIFANSENKKELLFSCIFPHFPENVTNEPVHEKTNNLGF